MPRRTQAIMMSATVKSAQAIHSRPSRRRSTSPSQRRASLRTSSLSLGSASPLPKISMMSMHTRVGSTVLTAAKHHWTTRVRPWTSPGISLPAFSAR
jgi:hypothetical protein